MEKINYGGWENCIRLSNDLVDLIVTTDVGPRVIRFGFVGDDNEFREFEEMVGVRGGDEWRIYGGHRLWHAPEATPRSYYPDNAPVEIAEDGGFTRVIQPKETTTGIQKRLDIRLIPGEAGVEVVHHLHNANLWAIELAPWALSVMAQGGKAIIPLPPRGPHESNLRPTCTIALWAYTGMADPRWTWGNRYVMLRQDPTMTTPQKAGVMVSDGWAAYARNGHLFVKRFNLVEGARYPDFGSTVEVFANADFLEVETLGPLVRLEPGATVEYVERWFLFDNVPPPAHDADVDNHVLPKIRATALP